LFIDIHVLRVVSVTVCAAIASLGLYTYLSQVISAAVSPHSSSLFLTSWGIGGFFGSFGVGFVMAKFKSTQILMLLFLVALSIMIALIPTLIKIPILGLLPFLLWGAVGWATQAPQQHIL